MSNSDASPRQLYAPPPSYLPTSPTHKLIAELNNKYNLNPSLASYEDLYAFSTTRIADFWGTVWDEVDIIGDKGVSGDGSWHVVDEERTPSENPEWFRDAKVNWAENMLRKEWRDGEKGKRDALVQFVEPRIGQAAPPISRTSYSALYLLVADFVSALLDLGLEPGDRIGAYCSNCIENIAACLATAAIGCIWVSAAADFGPEGVLERFEQVQPKVVISVDAVSYNGKVHPHLPKLSALLAGMDEHRCTPKKVVVINSKLIGEETFGGAAVSWDDFLAIGREKKLGRDETGEIQWKRLSFNWPLWILFSSGTTGKPIVHRAGGMLLQARKEFAICGDLKPSDVFFYYTTTGWMMWNFLVAGLASGCALVLYDGSPLRDPSLLWNLVDELGVTIFGTSAKYIDQLSKAYKPREKHRLSTLRHVYSTGSPLSAASFDFVYEHIHPEVMLSSITGGTDICSLFAGMCTALPVFRGEIQCRMLGMAIEAFDPTGIKCKPDEAGELVCTRPFPCQPAGFWPLEGFSSNEKAVEVAKKRYRDAYFEEFPGTWYHGDHVIVTRSRSGNGGGLVMLGRSDGVLNPGGVRFGSAELYDVIEACFQHGAAEIAEEHIIVDCLAVGQSYVSSGGAGLLDERVLLFVKLRDGCVCSDELRTRVKGEIRRRRTARHVPERIIQVQDIPYTLNGKRVEVPVKKIINGAPVSSINPATLRNPGCLGEYEELGRVLRGESGM